jgi:hypothetical protein
MPHDATARERLAASQAELMHALAGGSPVPAGFDPASVTEEARCLVAKRRRSVARARPVLARALGARFDTHFAAYAQACPRPAQVRDDAAAFARWFTQQWLAAVRIEGETGPGRTP